MSERTTALRRATALVVAAAAVATTLFAAPVAASAAGPFEPEAGPRASATESGPFSTPAPEGGAQALADDDEFTYYRYGYANRYENAAFITVDIYAEGEPVPVLYIASGQKYADALSAGPAAAHQGGGLLLVGQDSIPDITRAAIEYLQPQKLVVVGGPASVSDDVYRQLEALQPSIVRIVGNDRYQVSRNMIDYAFCGGIGGAGLSGGCAGPGSPDIFVATGANFPDALAAGPAAAHQSGAVLLVPGSGAALDAPSRDLLARAGATTARIAGGPASVSAGIEAELRSTVGSVVRYSGANRYEVAAAVNNDIFRGKVWEVFIASGLVFPDALSAGPAAAATGSPLFLVRPNCFPTVTADAVFWRSLDPEHLVVMGGPNTIGDGVVPNARLCE